MIFTSMTCGRLSHTETVTSALFLLGTPLYSKQANIFTHLFTSFASYVQVYAEKWLHSNVKSIKVNLVDFILLHFPFSQHMRINSGHSTSDIVWCGHTTTGRLTVTGRMKFKLLGSSFKTGEPTCRLAGKTTFKSVLINSRLISVSSFSAPDGMLTVQP